jgi:hypothetical protein
MRTFASTSVGDHGDRTGLKPHWRSFTNQIEGWPNNDEVTRDHVLFGRVFGSGRNDIVRMEQLGDKFDYVFHFYRNTGKGAKKVRGNGMRYCDVYGRGHDEYVCGKIRSGQKVTCLVISGSALTAQSSCSSKFDYMSSISVDITLTPSDST